MNRKLLNSELGRISQEEYLATEGSGLAVILDNVRSSHNVGSAFRSSDAFKVDKICLCGICDTPPSAAIHKSALGAENNVPWKHYGTAVEAIEELRSEGYTIVCVEQTAQSVSLEKFVPDATRKYALVFGNEVEGVEQEAGDCSDIAIEIPQYGTKHSLNVSVSIGILLWALHRS